MQSQLKRQATELKEKEFTLHHGNVSTVGTQARAAKRKVRLVVHPKRAFRELRVQYYLLDLFLFFSRA